MEYDNCVLHAIMSQRNVLVFYLFAQTSLFMFCFPEAASSSKISGRGLDNILQSKILRKDNFPLRFMRAKFLHFFGSLNLKGVFEKCNGMTINVLAVEGQGSSLLK